jgi:hypothetical protein
MTEFTGDEFTALDAPVLYERHNSSIAIFSPDMKYRYLLTREWESDSPMKLVVIGLNPSTATAEVDDPTIRRCIGYAKREMYGGLVMLNLFAFRATDPREMIRAAAEGVDVVGPANNAVIAQVITPGRNTLCAWGAHGEMQWRGEQLTKALVSYGANLMSFGTTKRGQPKHPLYLRNDAALIGYP